MEGAALREREILVFVQDDDGSASSYNGRKGRAEKLGLARAVKSLKEEK